MVSVICSSITPDEKFKKNIIKSSGLKPDDIDFRFYKNENEYSLTEVYARGLDEAKYDTIIFTHDDLIVNTKNWAKKIIKHFENTDYGILGVAGTNVFPETGIWWDEPKHCIGVVNHKHENKTHTSKFSANLIENIAPVVIVDGVFFAVRRDRIEVTFDEKIPSFHFYDVDFCYANHMANVLIGVMFDVRITHFSIGEVNDSWRENKQLFLNKWDGTLPRIIPGDIFCDFPSNKIKKEPRVVIKTTNLEFPTDFKDEIRESTDYGNYVFYDEDQSPGELILTCDPNISPINDALSIMVQHYLKNKVNFKSSSCRIYDIDNKLYYTGTLKDGIDIGKGGSYRYSEFITKTMNPCDVFKLETNKGGNQDYMIPMAVCYLKPNHLDADKS